MTKKRVLGWLLLLCLSLGLFAHGEAKAGEAAEETLVVIGTSTAPDGNLGLGLWSDNATSVDLRLLLHGCETVSWVRSLDMAFNKTVLQNVSEELQPDGDDIVVFELAPGLVYNNGEPIIARDYVFSLLLLASPELAALGVKPSRLEYLRGYEAYHAGTEKVLSGVRLLSDTAFSLRVKAEALPYFYGFARLGVQPYPISVIAPGCRVADDGQGAYLADDARCGASAEADARYVAGLFSADMLAATLLDPVNGYEVAPRVTNGPYELEEYDAAAGIVRLRVNPRYIGNYEGEKPTVERLEVRYVRSEEMIPKLLSGELDIAVRVSDLETVQQGQSLMGEYGSLRAVDYPRTGQAMLAFACERGPLASEEARRAVALCLDKDAIARQVGGERAQRVYGYYGKDQWMAEYVADPDDVVQPLNMPQELVQLDISQDFAAAGALLEADGWVLNGKGDPFREGTDLMRYREEDGKLMPLLLWMAQSEESTAAQRLFDMLKESLSHAGIGLRCMQMPFNDTLAQLYRRKERTFDLFFLSNNFSYLFDPFYELSPDEALLGIANKTGIQDGDLDALARELRATPTLNRDAYAVKWLAFQRHFMKALPMLPLYSTTYFDFYSDRLLAYTVNQHSGWALSIPYMRVH